MKKIALLCSILFSSILFAQEKPKGIYYEIFVRSFHDSNGDGIGDINGIIQKLDYLKNLGISGIWLTPVHPSPTYHKYDVLDYKGIDPEYGTIADYKLLVKEAHQRGIKILLDLVVNHTSSEHSWFKAACNNDPFYKNFYVWSDTARSHGWYSNPKNPQEKYYAFFWERMPDLNFDNENVRKHIIDAGIFWIREIGIDGFRLDAAQHVYEPNDVILNNIWWSEFRNAMKKINPNIFIVGEVWNKDSIVATYLKSSLDASFNFDLSISITKTLKDTNALGFMDKLINIHRLYSSFNPNFVDAIFISNHDQDRYRSSFYGDWAKTRQAFIMLMTLPGIPFIYYGEEIGMLGEFPDEYRREPMLWHANNDENTKWEKAKHSTLNTVSALNNQLNDTNSHFFYCKKIIALRNKYRTLSEGKLMPTKLVTSSKSIIAYELHRGKEKILVVHNISPNSESIKPFKYKKTLWGEIKNNSISGNGSIVQIIQ